MITLQPGDVVVHGIGPDSGFITRTIAKVTAAEWTHVGLVVEHRVLIEAWLPRVRALSPATDRLHALEAHGTSYRVLRPRTPLTAQQVVALTEEAWQHVGARYAWWQILWYALTGWFVFSGRANPICSMLVARNFIEVGYWPWRKEAVAALPGARRTQLDEGWCTPADVVQYGDFDVVAHFDGVTSSKIGVSA
jgi:hypothetical protein